MAAREARTVNKSHSTRAWLAPVFLVTAVVCWAGNHVVARGIAGHVPPFTLNMLRWLVVAVLVGIAARRSIVRDWPVMRENTLRLAILGALGGGLFGTLQYVSMQYTGVINMGVLNSIAPAFIVAASYILFRDRISATQILGICVSLAGVLAMVTALDPQRLIDMQFNRGDLIIIANMALFALYSSCLRLRPPIALTSFLFALAVAAALTNVPFAVYEHASGFVFPWDGKGFGAVAYTALFTSILAYLGWSRGVEMLGPSTASVFLHLIPLVNMVAGQALLNEPPRLEHIVGLVLILVGVALTARRPVTI
jgi:drug/metabolite transporter (DMT)-like permease